MAFDVAAYLEKQVDRKRTQLAKTGRQLAGTGAAPSKRRNKTQSGRSNLKGYHGRRALAKVGGMSDPMKAMYAPADYLMCVVVPDETGWLPNGDPRRL